MDILFEITRLIFGHQISVPVPVWRLYYIAAYILLLENLTNNLTRSNDNKNIYRRSIRISTYCHGLQQ